MYSFLVWLIFIGVIGLVLFLYFRFFKIPKLKNLVFVDGTLGSGKSMLSVNLAVRLYKRNLRFWRINCTLCRLLKRKEPEKPLLYSNIKLRNVPFVLVNRDLLTRNNVRFAYKSVLLLDELSLVVDQMDYKDKELSEKLSVFYKLFRHETRGGYMIMNSQAIGDLHYSAKYCLNDYFYIHSKTRLPFFSLLRVQECRYSADGSVVQNNDEDIENNLKVMLVPNKYFRFYDTYTYSIFSDTYKVASYLREYGKSDSLKADEFVTLKAKSALMVGREKENG